MTRRRGRVLVVDDEPMILQVLQRVLGNEHCVETTSSATVALERITAGERFDVVLCDLMMPQMTGMELHAALMELDPDQAGKLIFLTGGAFTPGARTFLEQTANLRVEKPFNLLSLKTLVNDRIR